MTSGDGESVTNWWERAIRSGWGQAARWLAVLGLVLWRWAEGWPSQVTGWLPVVIVALLLLLPDADSIAFGAVKLEMHRTREEMTGLRQQVTQLQIAQASAAAIGALNLTTENPEVAQVIAAAVRLTVQTAASEGTQIERYQPGAS